MYFREPNSQLELVVAVLSRGGVAIGDKIGYIDTSLIKTTCTKNGNLLRPDRPAKATPLQVKLTNLRPYKAMMAL